ncbi:MAG: hypothetical protein ACO4CS_03830 [bacterium]|jgi:hypothetical protein
MTISISSIIKSLKGIGKKEGASQQPGMTSEYPRPMRSTMTQNEYSNYQFSGYVDGKNTYNISIVTNNTGIDLFDIKETELIDFYFMIHHMLFEDEFQIFEPNDVY